MKASERLSDKEYENLSLEYQQSPPRLSGNPGFLSHMRETKLVNELLPPAEVIRYAIKKQLLENA